MAVREPKRNHVPVQTREEIISELDRGWERYPEVFGRRGEAKNGEITDLETCTRIIIEKCPFCGERHIHGGYGVRVPHCGSGVSKDFYTIFPPAGFVYFLQRDSGGSIKIGFATFVKTRIDLSLTWFDEMPRVLAVKPVESKTEERLYHRRFSTTRRRLEWFEPTDELIEEIESVRSEFVQPFFASKKQIPRSIAQQIGSIVGMGDDFGHQICMGVRKGLFGFDAGPDSSIESLAERIIDGLRGGE